MYLGSVTHWVGWHTEHKSEIYFVKSAGKGKNVWKKMFHFLFVCLLCTKLKTGGCADVWKIYLAKSADPVLQAGRRLKWKRCKTDWNIYWSKKHSCMPHAILRWASVRVIWLRHFAAKFSASKFAEAGAFFLLNLNFWDPAMELRLFNIESLFTCKGGRTVNGAPRRERFK